MLSDKEFDGRWARISKKGKKFIIRYIENGLNAYEASAYADFHGKYLNYPTVPLRKYNDLIDYLLKKNKIIETFVKPEWIMSQYKDIYERSESEVTKVNILNNLAKILSMVNTNTEVNVQNNIPQTPVIIRFDKEDE